MVMIVMANSDEMKADRLTDGEAMPNRFIIIIMPPPAEIHTATTVRYYSI